MSKKRVPLNIIFFTLFILISIAFILVGRKKGKSCIFNKTISYVNSAENIKEKELNKNEKDKLNKEEIPPLPSMIKEINPPYGSEGWFRKIEIVFWNNLLPVLTTRFDPIRDSVLGYFTIEPFAKGNFFIEEDKRVVFIFEGNIPAAVNFTIKIRKGFTDAKGNKLKEDFVWKFSTPLPDINFFPECQHHISIKGGDFGIISSAQLDSESVRKKMRIVDSKGNNIFYTLKEERCGWNDKYKYFVVIDKENELKKESIYKLILDKGVKTKGGNRLTDKKYEYSFKTYPTFRFVGVEDVDIDGDKYVLFVFTNPLYRSTIEGGIEIYEKNIKINEFEVNGYWADSNNDIKRKKSEFSYYYFTSNKLKGDTKYKVKIKSELKDVYEQKIKNPCEFYFRTFPLKPSLSCKENIFSVIPNHKLKITTTSLNGIHYRYKMIDSSEIISTWDSLIQKKSEWWKIDYKIDRIIEYIDSENIYEWEEPRDSLSPFSYISSNSDGEYKLGDVQKGIEKIPFNNKIPITTYLSLPKFKSGILLYNIFSPLVKTKDYKGNKKIRFFKGSVNITDLGITVQIYPTCGIVKVNSITTGNPVSKADVAIYRGRINEYDSIGSKLLVKGQTDENGIFFYTLPEIPEHSIYQLKEPKRFLRFLVTVRKEDDWTFKYIHDSYIELIRRNILNREENFSKWEDGDNEDIKYEGLIFSDRYLYKAGDTVFLKGVIRYKRYGKTYPLKNSKLQLKIAAFRSRGTVIDKEIFTNKFGTFTFKIVTDENWKSGEYSAYAIKYLNNTEKKEYIKEEDNSIYIPLGGSFRITEFRTPQVNITLEPIEVLKDKSSLKVSYKATYFDGTPMAGVKSRLRIVRDSPYFNFPQWKDFDFLIKRFDSRTILEEEVVLDSMGSYSKIIGYDTTIKSPVVYSAYAIVKIENGQEAAAIREETFYKPLIGVRFNKSYENDSPWVDVIVIDSAGNLRENTLLNVSIVKKIDEKEQIVKEETIKSDILPIRLNLNYLDNGTYKLKFTLKDSVDEYVAERDFEIRKELEKEEKKEYVPIEVVTDKKFYKIGDSVKVFFYSPFNKAEMLLTVSNNKITHKYFKLIQKGKNEYSFKVTREMEPESYVIVSLFNRDNFNPKDTFYCRDDWGPYLFRMGMARFEVDISHKSLDIELHKSRGRIKPGEMVKVNLKVKRRDSNSGYRSELAVMVVDDALLSLSDYRAPSLIDTFYKGKERLSVIVADNRSIYFHPERIPRFEKAGKIIERSVDIRKEFKSTCYYNGALLTDNEGNASFTFKVPDNLTKWRIMVVAVGEDSLFGYKEDSVEVSLPIAIREIIPNFIRSGDIFEGGFLVTNSTKEEGKILLEGEVVRNLLKIEGENKKELNIKGGETKCFLFNIKAAGEKGEEILRFKAFFEDKKGNRYSDALEKKIKIESLKPTERVYVIGPADSDIVQKVNIFKNSRKDVGGVDIEISNTLLSSLQEGIKYIVEYPYECLEQRVSRMLVVMNLIPLYEKYGFNLFNSKEEIDFIIKKNLKEILKLQDSEGGFKLWKESPESDKFLSCEVATLFNLCKKYNYRVPDSNIIKLKNFLKREVSYDYDVDEKSKKRIRERNIFFLNGIVQLCNLNRKELNEVKRIFDKRDKISLYSRIKLCRLLNILSFKGEVEILKNEIKKEIREERDVAYFPFQKKILLREIDTLKGEFFYGLLYRNCEESEALLLLLESEEDNEMIYKLVRYILSEIDKEGRWMNTYITGKNLQALSEYADKKEISGGQCELKVFVNNRELGNYIFVDRKEYKPLKIFVPMRELYVGENEVKIERRGEKRIYYYSIGCSNRLDRVPRRIKEEGYEIIRRVKRTNGEVLEYGDVVTKDTITIKKGEEIIVELEYKLGNDKNVALEDQFAACFEFVDKHLSSKKDYMERYLDNYYSISPFTSREIRENRVTLFGEDMKSAGGKYEYYLRAICRGIFFWPYASVFDMYAPSKIGTTTEGFVKVE